MRMENGFGFCLDMLDIPKAVKNLINSCVHFHWELSNKKDMFNYLVFY